MRVLEFGRNPGESARGGVERDARADEFDDAALDRHADVRERRDRRVGVAAHGDGRRAAQVPGEAGERDGA